MPKTRDELAAELVEKLKERAQKHGLSDSDIRTAMAVGAPVTYWILDQVIATIPLPEKDRAQALAHRVRVAEVAAFYALETIRVSDILLKE